MTPPPRLVLASVATLLAAFVLVSCSAAPAEEPEPVPTVETPVVSTEPDPEPEPEDEAEQDEESPAPSTPTCDEMLYAGTRDRMLADGWTYLEDEFRIGEILLDEGVICSWSDYAVASDHGQFFGWAPISADTARSAQSYLIGEGWLRENATDGVYITENPSFAFVLDDDGYGMTYFFGDGWVMLADVRQNLALIDWQG